LYNTVYIVSIALYCVSPELYRETQHCKYNSPKQMTFPTHYIFLVHYVVSLQTSLTSLNIQQTTSLSLLHLLTTHVCPTNHESGILKLIVSNFMIFEPYSS
jgi:hypothetical protein